MCEEVVTSGRDAHSESSQSCFQLCKVLVGETGAAQELLCCQSSTQAGAEQGRGILIMGILDMNQCERITQNDSAAEMSAIKTKCFMLHMLRFLKLNSEQSWKRGGLIQETLGQRVELS